MNAPGTDPAAAPTAAGGHGGGKKAVHVKWAGKTIALGTFPSNEADEKCQKAKALTRAWRSTMRPKPSREWVMLELERLGVRVVSGRLGRKAGEDGEDLCSEAPVGGKHYNHNNMQTGVSVSGGLVAPVGMMQQQPAASVGGGGLMERSGSIGWGSSDADLSTLMQARRNSSLGLSMMNDTLGRRGSLGSLGQMMGLGEDPTIPPHRPLVGGGAAAAYEAARHDHFAQKSAEQQRHASSLGLGSLGGGAFGGMGMSVNPNQHYEMLKLHHMNLLNEIQETTLMMNLYQQQQLQQQQQQLQQQASAEQMGSGTSGADSQLSLLMHQQNGLGTSTSMTDLYGLGQRGSLGLGAVPGPGVYGGMGMSSAGGLGSAGGLAQGGLSMQNLLQQQHAAVKHAAATSVVQSPKAGSAPAPPGSPSKANHVSAHKNNNNKRSNGEGARGEAAQPPIKRVKTEEASANDGDDDDDDSS